MEFVKNEATGFYECKLKVNSEACKVYVKQPAGKHVRLLWNDLEDEEPAEFAVSIPYKGIFAEQVKSEWSEYWLTIECGSIPIEANVTEH